MKILNRAKHLYSDEYFISDSVIFEYGNMFLVVNGTRKECDISTRSLNFSDMIDSEGTKIFASLSEDSKGGDKYIGKFATGMNGKSVRTKEFSDTVCFNSVNGVYLKMRFDYGNYRFLPNIEDVKVTGIQD